MELDIANVFNYFGNNFSYFFVQRYKLTVLYSVNLQVHITDNIQMKTQLFFSGGGGEGEMFKFDLPYGLRIRTLVTKNQKQNHNLSKALSPQD